MSYSTSPFENGITLNELEAEDGLGTSSCLGGN